MATSILHEYTGNIHIHTTYSDGSATHAEIARAAIAAGLDFIIVTDHNVLVKGVEGYYHEGSRRVLLLTGQEVHNPRREPGGSHLLVLGNEEELSPLAADPQALIDAANDQGALTFLAHPFDGQQPQFGLNPYPWLDWHVQNYTGLELWNYMSSFKEVMTGRVQALRALLNPNRWVAGPDAQTLALWDKLLSQGHKLPVLGGSDAHAFLVRVAGFQRKIFPYEDLFRGVNTHIFLHTPLSGNLADDKRRILAALKEGRSFAGFDALHPTAGFRFSAQGFNFNTTMGGSIRLGHGITLQIGTPRLGQMRLLHNGEVILRVNDNTHKSFIANQPGVYRVEVDLMQRGKARPWIFSNPIYALG